MVPRRVAETVEAQVLQTVPTKMGGTGVVYTGFRGCTEKVHQDTAGTAAGTMAPHAQGGQDPGDQQGVGVDA